MTAIARQGREIRRDIYKRRGKEKGWLDRVRQVGRGRLEGRGDRFC